MSKHARMLGGSTVLFEVIITGTGRNRTHTLKLTVGPGDNMEPMITITLPEEDKRDWVHLLRGAPSGLMQKIIPVVTQW